MSAPIGDATFTGTELEDYIYATGAPNDTYGHYDGASDRFSRVVILDPSSGAYVTYPGYQDLISYEGMTQYSVVVDLAAGVADGLESGHDTLINFANVFGTAFADTIYGDDFTNYFGFSNGLFGGGGGDVVFGRGGYDQLYGGDGDDVLDGGAGDDRLYDGAGNDLVYGGLGDDHFYGGLGDDLLDGGADANFVSYYYLLTPISGLLTSQGVDLGPLGTDTFVNILEFEATNFDDVMYVLSSIRVDGGADDDRLEGGVGKQLLTGGDGDDILRGGLGADLLGGGEGDDLVVGELGDDGLSGGFGNDAVYGQDGDDFITGGRGDDLVDGGSGADYVAGDFGDDVVVGREGDDEIVGGDGNDILVGEDGDDTMRGEGGDDFVAGGAGNDLMFGEGALGPGGKDTMYGDAGDDIIAGGSGDDLLSGEDGDDIVAGDDGGDLVVGGGGNDALVGNAGVDVLVGGDGEDTLRGDEGGDVLIGDSGGDTLIGGAGGDVFFFRLVSDSAVATGVDLVVDFQEGNDLIDLRQIDAIGGGADDAFSFVSAFTGQAGQATLIYLADSNRTIFQGDVDGDGLADFVLAMNGQLTEASGWLL